MFKKIGNAVSDAATQVGDNVTKATSKPKSKDEDFEELRSRFKNHYSAVEKIKKEASKLQDDTRTHVKCYKNLGDELDGVFSIGNEEHGKRYKSWANSLETASTELQAGIGEVVAGTEVLLNICGGLAKRIQQRDSLLMDMEIADKRRDKGHKEAMQSDEARQKYEEVNTKLKTDLREALRDGLPKFRGHYERLIKAQQSAFHHMSVASEELA